VIGAAPFIRRVLRAPGTFATAVGILGLGIGSAVAIYSAVDAILIEPLPFPEGDRLVEIRTERGGEPALISMREVEDLRERSQGVLGDVAAYIPGGQYSIAGRQGPEKPPAILTTENLFDVLGVAPALGGTWPASWDRERSFGLVLGHDLWERQFAADAGAVGSTVALDASPFYSPSYEVFGVMPEDFDFPTRTDLYRSIFINDGFPGLEDRESRLVVGIARLAEGADVATAQALANRTASELAATHPESNRGVRIVVRPLRDHWAASIRGYLLVLLGASFVLLLGGCANVANLFLTRTLAREPEYALRAALGAGRGRILLGLAAEGIVAGVAGGLLGLAGAAAVLSRIDPSALGLPRWMQPEIDVSVALFAIGLSVATGILVGVWPGRAGIGPNVMARLRQGTQRSGAGTRGRRLRETLVVAEVAVSLTLLLASGLLSRTFLELSRVDPGLDAERLLTLQIPLPWSYPMEERLAFQEEVLTRTRALPGVVAAATNANPPLVDVGQPDRAVLEVEGQPPEAREASPYMNIQRVSPGYFEALGIPVLEGRAFDAAVDRDSTLLAAVVSARLAERLWPGESAIGRRLRRPAPDQPWWEVVGVAGDVRQESLTDAAGFDVYLSSLQAIDGWAYLFVRTAGDPMDFEAAVRGVVASVDPGQPVVDVRTMASRLLETVGPQRLAAGLFGFFALTALMLAAAGIFAVVSVVVRQRTAELGIRMALGATRSRVFGSVVSGTMVPVAIGIGIGLAGGAAVAYAVRPLLYGVRPTDPLVFVGVPAAIALVAFLAAALPAFRAARLDPSLALRERS